MTARPPKQPIILRIAVASDLHAFDDCGADPSPSHLKTTLPEDQPTKHPISGLIELVKSKSLSADILLCPGDLGDKARPAGIQYAWKKIGAIQNALGATLAMATVGNHDLDSRYKTSPFDPKETLQALEPPYPLPDDADNNKYWARHFVLKDCGTYRLLILNSSAYHGGNPEEIDHGRIAQSTISQVKKELSDTEVRPVNILLCHHHPQLQAELSEVSGYDVMTNGQSLLDLLGSAQFGRWLVVHGHKHNPKISYAAGGGSSPVVFSAGSLCASLYLELGTVVRNQFHLISIPYDSVERLGLVGRVESWDWASGAGWASAAGPLSGLPAICGFGYRGDPLILAQRMSLYVGSNTTSWKQVQAHLPEIDFVLPQDLAAIKADLRKSHGLAVLDIDGAPVEIGKSL